MTIAAAMAITAVLLALTTALTAGAPPVRSQDVTSMGDASDLASMMIPKAAVMAVSTGNTAGGNVTMTVPYSIKVYNFSDVDYSAVTTFSKPLQLTFNASTGIGRFSMADVLPVTAKIDFVNRTSVPVAGTIFTVAFKDINVTGVSEKKFDFEFGKMIVYLPGGKPKAYHLDKPIKMSYTIDGTAVTIKADPTFVKAIASLINASSPFAAGASPVKLVDILSAPTA